MLRVRGQGRTHRAASQVRSSRARARTHASVWSRGGGGDRRFRIARPKNRLITTSKSTGWSLAFLITIARKSQKKCFQLPENNPLLIAKSNLSYRLPLAVVLPPSQTTFKTQHENEMIVYVSNVGIYLFSGTSFSFVSIELCTWQTETVNWSTYVPTKNKRKGPF